MLTTKKSKKELRITDSNKFPDDFWNYFVNPILGYYYNHEVNKNKVDR